MVRRLFINTMNNERCRPQPMRAALSLPIEHALENSTDISAEITFGKCAFTLIAFSLIFFSYQWSGLWVCVASWMARPSLHSTMYNKSINYGSGIIIRTLASCRSNHFSSRWTFRMADSPSQISDVKFPFKRFNMYPNQFHLLPSFSLGSYSRCFPFLLPFPAPFTFNNVKWSKKRANVQRLFSRSLLLLLITCIFMQAFVERQSDVLLTL